MTDKEKKEWLIVKYPLTIICDRYDGTYSGAKWLAFPRLHDQIPMDVDGDDLKCKYFWENYLEPVGKGAYANDAVADLIKQMMEKTEKSEDDVMIESIKGALIAMSIGPAGYDTYKKEIAWLEKQKKQKPAKWSEEDEKLIEEVCRCLCEYAGYYKEKDMEALDYHLFKLSLRLKSLCPQPHWKPSEEQMEALRVTLEYMPDTFKLRCTLMTLYNDLKKL